VVSVYKTNNERWLLYNDGQRRIIAEFDEKADADFAALAFARREEVEGMLSSEVQQGDGI
jgi:hypothetical protein